MRPSFLDDPSLSVRSMVYERHTAKTGAGYTPGRRLARSSFRVKSPNSRPSSKTGHPRPKRTRFQLPYEGFGGSVYKIPDKIEGLPREETESEEDSGNDDCDGNRDFQVSLFHRIDCETKASHRIDPCSEAPTSMTVCQTCQKSQKPKRLDNSGLSMVFSRKNKSNPIRQPNSLHLARLPQPARPPRPTGKTARPHSQSRSPNQSKGKGPDRV